MQPTNSIEEIAFFQAIANGQASAITEIVTRNPSILDSFNYRSFGATPLTSVCFSNRSDLVDLLLDLGADPNRRSDWHMGPWSPLHCAIYRRDYKLAEKLLARGATLDAHTAAGLGWCDELEKLLAADPQCVHERGGDGCLPLHFADTVEVAELLLARGAQIDRRCIDHYSTPVQFLCTVRPTVARYLLGRGASADVFSTVLCGDDALLEQLLTNNPSLVDARIDQSFFPPSSEHDVHNILTFTVGQHATPLHAAANSNCHTAIPILLRYGAQVGARGGYDAATPLHLAAWNDCLEAATELVDGGADLNIKSGKLHNNSPAGWAIVGGSQRVFNLLLDRGAEIFPWFVEDAKAGCEGQFDQVKNVPREVRTEILSRLENR